MQKKPKPLSSSPRYRSFTRARDEILEVILNRYLNSASEIVSLLKHQCVDLVAGLAASHALTPPAMHKKLPVVETRIRWLCEMSAAATYDLALKLRRSSYTLAHVGEAEAIARALGKPMRAQLTRHTLIGVASEDAPSGGPLRERLVLYFSKLSDQIAQAVRYSMLLEEPSDEAKARLLRAFPRARTLKRFKRNLKPVPMREASKNLPNQDPEITDEIKAAPNSLVTGFVDDEAWNQVVSDYLGENLPGPRGPSDIIEVSGQERYEWQVEQELMQDFVDRVRDGQVDAATENGIEDLMWIAIVDDATDDCCLKRDGLTSSEIEEKLKGEWKHDECQASVAPAHFNCRCVMAPVSKDLPETTPPDYGDVDQWLNAR